MARPEIGHVNDLGGQTARGCSACKIRHFAGSGFLRKGAKGTTPRAARVRYAFDSCGLNPHALAPRLSGDDLHRTAPVSLPANARKQTMAPPSNHRR